MLNITPQSSAEGAKRYFSRSDYYEKDSQELIGRWGGKGAAILGLSGESDKHSFDQLCDNLDPRTGKPLTMLTRENRRVGYDFTFSAPKSTSVIHALTGDERILDAFRQSIDETMLEIQDDMHTRVRKGKVEQDRKTGNMVWAEFVHLTSRPVENIPCPQLHSHVFCFNATYDAKEKRWKAGQFEPIKSVGYYWQAVQQARFANKLQELGYSIRKTKDAFEIVSVSNAVKDRFSLRTAVIERKAKELGITNPKEKAKLAALTREAKNSALPYTELVALWKQWVTPVEQKELSSARGASKHVVDNSAQSVRYAVDHTFYRDSVADEKRLLALALRHGCGQVTPEGVRREMDRIGLIKREENGKVLTTTREVLNEETRMLKFAVAGKGTCRPIVQDAKQVQKALEGSILSDEQRKAAEHILCTPDRVTILTGKAGVGKTTLTHATVEQMEAAGKGVVMVAPTAQASRGVLREEGFDAADTLAMLMKDEDMKAKATNGVIWVDEAGLVGTRSMLKLFDFANQNGSRIVLAGDEFQMASVERGRALRDLKELAGIKYAEVSEIRRQSGDYKAAMALMARGMVVDGINKLDAMGWVKTMAPGDGYGEVANDYVDKLKECLGRNRVEKLQTSGDERDIEKLQEIKDKEKGVLIECATHAEGSRIVEAVRKEMRAELLIGTEDHEFLRLVPLQWTPAQQADKGQYAGDEILQFHRNSKAFKAGQRVESCAALRAAQFPKEDHFSVFGQSSIKLAKGDIIRVTATGFSKDGLHKLNNGSVYTVSGFTKGGDITLNNGWTIARTFGHVNYAYANTGFAVQGRTVQHTIVVQSGKSHFAGGRESLYVGASRGRISCTFYTDSKEELRQAAARLRPRMSATELVRRPMGPLWPRVQKLMAQARSAAMLVTKAAAWQSLGREREFAHGR